MPFDTPRTNEIPQDGEAASGHEVRRSDRTREARNRLLTLAADLDDQGVSCRLVESKERPSDYPVVLRCWNPHRMSFAREVTCVPGTGEDTGTWWYQYLLPAGQTIADATDALHPGDATRAAEKISGDLKVRA